MQLVLNLIWVIIKVIFIFGGFFHGYLLSFLISNIAVCLLIIYIMQMKKIEKISKSLWKYGVISLLVAIVSVYFFNNSTPFLMDTLSKFESILYPLVFTMLLFVFNFYSSNLLNKPFSYYFAKSISNLVYMFIPLIVRMAFILLGIQIEVLSILIIYVDVFYSLFMFSILIDIYKWNKGEFIEKYKPFYADVLVALPFEATEDNELYYQWNSFIDNADEQNGINYREVYTRRITRLSSLKKTMKKLTLDQFTMRLIELSVTDQNELEIDLASNGEYNYYPDFLKQTSTKFLYELIMLPNFKFKGSTPEQSFSTVVQAYFEKVDDDYISTNVIMQLVINAREGDLNSALIKTELYWSLYRCNKLEAEINHLEYESDVENAVIVDAIVQKHNQLIGLDNVKVEQNHNDRQYPSTLGKIKHGRFYDETLFENYQLFDNAMKEYEQLFTDVTKRIYWNFESDGAISTTILNSNIVKIYYQNYYQRKINSLMNNRIDEKNLISELNILLSLADKLYWCSTETEKHKMCDQITNILMHYSDILFDDANTWSNVEYLSSHYTVGNGLLSQDVRNKIKECLTRTGHYKVSLDEDLKRAQSSQEKEQIINEFYETFKEQFNNDEWYILIENEEDLVKSKWIAKSDIFKIIIRNCADHHILDKFLKEFLNIEYFNIALGRLWVFEKKKYDMIADLAKPKVLLGVHDVLKHVNASDSKDKEELIGKIGSNEFQYFINLFKDVKVVKDLEVSLYMGTEYIEELGIPYTINNFDELALKEFEFDWGFHLNQMSEPSKFIIELLKSQYVELINFDWKLFYEINIHLKIAKESAEEINKILEDLIILISEKKVVDDRYQATNIFEYEDIKKSYKSIDDEKIKELFTKKILAKIDNYFISELFEE